LPFPVPLEKKGPGTANNAKILSISYLLNSPVTGGCKTDTGYSKTGSGSGLSYPDAAADAEGCGRGDSVKAAELLYGRAVVDGYPSEGVS